MGTSPRPTDIKLHQQSKKLEVSFDDDSTFEFSCEFLRVYSPSAEVQGHGPGEEILQVGKKDVNIERIEPVGNYAIQLFYDDGHDSGIYSWETLYNYGKNMDEMWAHYVERMDKAGKSREQAKMNNPKAIDLTKVNR